MAGCRNDVLETKRSFGFSSKMSWQCGVVFLFLAILSLSKADPCTSPKATSKVYSTSNVLLSTESVFLVESKVECSNNPESLHLYAEIDGHLYPVSRSTDGSVYQFSWVAKHTKAKSGTYTVSYYDNEGYAALRKAQRGGEESEHKPLFTVDLHHKAAGREGLWVQTEFIAVTAALLIWWFATVTKNKMQE